MQQLFMATIRFVGMGLIQGFGWNGQGEFAWIPGVYNLMSNHLI